MIDRTFDPHHLIKLMQEIGYPSIDDDGICAGITGMVLQASSAKKISDLHKRLELIDELHEILPERFKEIEEKTKKHEILSEKEKEILDIRAFLDGIALHQNPENYQDMLGKFFSPASRHTEHLSYYTSSEDKKESKGNKIKEVFSCPAITSTEELKNYFHQISAMAHVFKKDFSMIFSSIRHRILLHYDSREEKFYLFDPNHLSFVSTNSRSLPEKLLTAFHPAYKEDQDNIDKEKNNIHSATFAFETSIFSSEENESSLRSLLETSIDPRVKIKEAKITDYFYPTFKIDPEKAERVGDDGISLIWIAAHNNHADIVDELITECGVEPNPKYFLEDGSAYTTLLDTVITLHHTEVLEKLIPHLDKQSKTEALSYAIKLGNLAAVQLLVKSGTPHDGAIKEAKEAEQHEIKAWLQTYSSSSRARMQRLGIGLFESAPINDPKISTKPNPLNDMKFPDEFTKR